LKRLSDLPDEKNSATLARDWNSHGTNCSVRIQSFFIIEKGSAAEFVTSIRIIQKAVHINNSEHNNQRILKREVQENIGEII